MLSFVVVGGGPTGVEVAAELRDLVVEDVARTLPHIAVGACGLGSFLAAVQAASWQVLHYLCGNFLAAVQAVLRQLPCTC